MAGAQRINRVYTASAEVISAFVTDLAWPAAPDVAALYLYFETVKLYKYYQPFIGKGKGL